MIKPSLMLSQNPWNWFLSAWDSVFFSDYAYFSPREYPVHSSIPGNPEILALTTWERQMKMFSVFLGSTNPILISFFIPRDWVKVNCFQGLNPGCLVLCFSFTLFLFLYISKLMLGMEKVGLWLCLLLQSTGEVAHYKKRRERMMGMSTLWL